MDKIQRIKQIKTQLPALRDKSTELSKEIALKQKENQKIVNQLKKMEDELKELEDCPELKVSEHAILRYFERVKGYDINAIESEILSSEVMNMTKTLGDTGKFPHKEGFTVVMAKGTVTTIIK